MRRLTVSGTYHEIGLQLGEVYREEFRELVERRRSLMESELHVIGGSFDTSRFEAASGAMMASMERETPDAAAEVKGVSQATAIPTRELLLALAYTDMFDLFVPDLQSPTAASQHECTSFVTRDHGGPFSGGQTWDMTADTSQFVALVEKRPPKTAPFYAYSLLGCLAYLGVTADGVCLGTTKVTSCDIGYGVCFPALVQACLQSSTPAGMLHCLSKCSRVAGHYFYLLTPKSAWGCEVSANTCIHWQIMNTPFVHTNHFVLSDFRPEERPHSASSALRMESMNACLASVPGFAFDDYKRALFDHSTGLCRHALGSDLLLTVTGTAIYFDPGNRRFLCSDGPPCGEKWLEVLF